MATLFVFPKLSSLHYSWLLLGFFFSFRKIFKVAEGASKLLWLWHAAVAKIKKRSNYCIRNWCELCEQNCVSLPAGDTIYGRVMVDPVQNLGDSFICNIEKVFLCTGTDGYVPKYNPSNFEFGCLADSPSLLYRFKIIVRNKLIFSIFLDSVQSSWSFTPFLLLGQGPARDPGKVIWQCSLQSLTGCGWSWCFSSGQTAWVRWLQNGLLRPVPGQ